MILKDTSKFLPHFVATLLAATMLVAPLPAQAAVGNCVVTTSLDDVDPAPIGSLRECSEKLGSQGFEDGISVTFNVDSVSLVAPVVFAASSEAYSVTLSGPVEITQAMEFTSVDWIGESVFFDRPLYFLDGIVTLDNLTVTDALDGAVYVSAPELHVMNSTFSDNSTRSASLNRDGAAIYSDSGITTIENSAFSGNASDASGGAIYALSDISIATSHFENNSAQNNGGAISGDDDLSATYSSFLNNRAGDVGGALFADEEAFAGFTTFLENSAEDDGGAVWAEDHFYSGFNTLVNNSSTYGVSAVHMDDDDLVSIGTIFASDTESSSMIYYSEDSFDFGGNLITSSEDDFDAESSSFSVDIQDLFLGEPELLENGTYGLYPGSTSVLIDRVTQEEVNAFISYVNEDRGGSPFWNLEMTLDQAGNAPAMPFTSGSIDVPGELQPVPYLGPVVTNDPETAQSGSAVTYSGSDLDEVTSATIAGQSAAIVSKSASSLTLRVPAGLTQGMHDVVLHYSTTESLTLQNGLVVQDLMKVWTQLQSDNTVKMYAKNIIGEGKIQFFHNGNEIGWVRATNALNPKLRQANGSSYLVRTRELVDGKNSFEIYQDGTRIWRASYSN